MSKYVLEERVCVCMYVLRRPFSYPSACYMYISMCGEEHSWTSGKYSLYYYCHVLENYKQLASKKKKVKRYPEFSSFPSDVG